ncbi:MAG: transposase [Gaiellaceae bacterium]
MARLLRSHLPDGFFHVTARGVDGTLIVRTREDGLAFLRLLRSVVERFDWTLYAFCVMPNHYHLVLQTTREHLSRGCHRLNGIYAQAFNQRHERRGHLFGDRFWSGLIESDTHAFAASRYVVYNPVRAGLCTEAEDWPLTGCRYGVTDV